MYRNRYVLVYCIPISVRSLASIALVKSRKMEDDQKIEFAYFSIDFNDVNAMFVFSDSERFLFKLTALMTIFERYWSDCPVSCVKVFWSTLFQMSTLIYMNMIFSADSNLVTAIKIYKSVLLYSID